jgi:hypothetical protein
VSRGDGDSVARSTASLDRTAGPRLEEVCPCGLLARVVLAPCPHTPLCLFPLPCSLLLSSLSHYTVTTNRCRQSAARPRPSESIGALVRLAPRLIVFQP